MEVTVLDVEALKTKIRDIPDFPKPGVLFRDITPLLADPACLRYAVDAIADHYQGERIDLVLGAEARGFILGAAIAYRLGAGFIPARKPGKLPHKVTSAEYALEYGTDSLEMHQDAVTPGHSVLIVDDVLATGGTASAKIELVNKLGGCVAGVAFLIELSFLNGRERLSGQDVFSLITY